MDFKNILNFIREFLPLLTAMIVIIIESGLLKLYSQKSKLFKEQMENNEKYYQKRMKELEDDKIESFSLIKEREATLKLFEHLLKKEKELINEEKVRKISNKQTLDIDSYLTTMMNKVSNLESLIIQSKISWEKPAIEGKIEKIDSELKQQPQDKLIINIATLSKKDNERLNFVLEKYMLSKESILYLEVVSGSKSKRAIYELRDMLDHFMMLLAKDISEEKAAAHIVAIEEHLKRTALVPLEWIALVKFHKALRKLWWGEKLLFFAVDKRSRIKEQQQKILKVQTLISEARKLEGCSIYSNEFNVSIQKFKEAINLLKEFT